MRSRVWSRFRSVRQRSQYADVRSRSRRMTVKRSPQALQRTRRSFIALISFASPLLGVTRLWAHKRVTPRHCAPRPLSPALGRPVRAGRPPRPGAAGSDEI